MDQEDILTELFAREESAIYHMQQCYGAYCAAVARNVLENDQDVEEVVSDTWLRAWNSIPPERPRHLKLYLARIARNLSFDRFRNQTRQKRGGTETACTLEELAECIGADGPELILEAQELKTAVNQFLAPLPRRDRQVFLLRYFYVESAAAIAHRFSIREDHVRTILSRTRKKLRIYLIKEGFLNE